MNKPFAIAALSSLLLLSGCVTTPQNGLYWGNYSHTLYEVKKSGDENSFKKHMNELHKIISTSEKRNLKVPPGIFAELGQLYQKDNKPQEAMSFYQREVAAYPESKQLMSRIISHEQNFPINFARSISPSAGLCNG